EELMAFKGTKPHDEALRRLADHLTLEYTRAFGMKLPETFGVGPGVVLSSTVFVRHHLPLRRMCKPLLPVIALPEPPHVVLALPERFWPRPLVRAWVSGALD
ncbi:MAG: hypothetical protein AAFS10_09135, partial [Myxococcota bacterium]